MENRLSCFQVNYPHDNLRTTNTSPQPTVVSDKGMYCSSTKNLANWRAGVNQPSLQSSYHDSLPVS